MDFILKYFHIVIFGIRDFYQSLITKLFSYGSPKIKRDWLKMRSVFFLILLFFAKSQVLAKTPANSVIGISNLIATYSNVASTKFTVYATNTNTVSKWLSSAKWMTSATDFGLISSTLYLPIQVYNSNNFTDVFTIEVMSNTIPGVIAHIYADYNANGIVDGSDRIITNTMPIAEGASNQIILAVYIPPSASIGITNRTILKITSSLTNKMKNYYQYSTNYIITYYATNGISDVFANDGVKTITTFNGSDYLDDHDILVSVKLDKQPQDMNSVILYYDVGEIPDGQFGANTEDRAIVLHYNGEYWQGVIPESDYEIIDGAQVQFVVEIDNVVYKLSNNRPWKFLIKQRPDQGNGFNVFPTIVNLQNNDVLQMYYHVNQTGPIQIFIYDLKGDFVRKFDEGVKEPGEYGPVYWDGTNKYGNTVAIGLYFVHIKGKQLGETRKVIILK